MDDLSVIQAIVNKSKVNQDDMVYISYEDMISIDKLKAKIAKIHLRFQVNIILE